MLDERTPRGLASRAPVITSPANPRVRAALGLRERRARDREGRLLVDGLREVARAVEAGARVIEAFVTDPPPGGEEGRALVAALRVAGAEVVIVSPAVQARLAYGERTNGLVAVVATPGRSLDVLALPPDALVAVLEGVEKPGNLGAIVRSADGAGLAAVVATGPGADPWNPNAIRASQGAVFSLAVVAASTDETLAWLRGTGLRIVAARVDGAVPYTAVDLRGPVALVLGAEATGLTESWRVRTWSPCASRCSGARTASTSPRRLRSSSTRRSASALDRASPDERGVGPTYTRAVRRTLPLLAALILAASGVFSTAALGGPGRAATPVRVYLGEPSTLDPAAAGDAGSAADHRPAVRGPHRDRSAAGHPPRARRNVGAPRRGAPDRLHAARRASPSPTGRRSRPTTSSGAGSGSSTPSAPSPLASLLYDVEGARAYVRGESTDPATVGLRALDARHLEVRLTRPAADFPAIAASPTLAVVPPGVGRDASALQPGSGFVASGGYVLAARTDTAARADGQRALLGGHAGDRRRPDRRRASPARARSTRSLPASSTGRRSRPTTRRGSPTTRTSGPRSGRAPTWRSRTTASTMRRPPFDDVRVRRAFAQAVDWRRIVALAGGSDTIPATGMVPPGIPGRSDEDFLPTFDPAAARELLRQAGYAGGVGFPVVTIVTGGTGYDAAIIAQLKANLGIDVRYEAMDFDDVLRRACASDPPQMWAISWIADYPSPNDFLGILLGSDQPNNYGGWSSAAVRRGDHARRGDVRPRRRAGRLRPRPSGSSATRCPSSRSASGTAICARPERPPRRQENGLGILRLAGLAWGAGQ